MSDHAGLSDGLKIVACRLDRLGARVVFTQGNCDQGGLQVGDHIHRGDVGNGCGHRGKSKNRGVFHNERLGMIQKQGGTLLYSTLGADPPVLRDQIDFRHP